MTRLARTLAKLQPLTPAPECALTDQESTKRWLAALNENNPNTRGGGVTVTSRLAAAPKHEADSKATSKPDSRPAAPSVPARPDTKPAAATWNEVRDASNFYGSQQVIRQKCEAEWPNDPRMFGHCFERQLEARDRLQQTQSAPWGVDEGAWRNIRVKCANEWPSDFSMRDYCERRQIEAWKKYKP
ncbi:MAG TPA: hypothetical protein VF701_08615 [Thermoanaerobaculia bacterium]